MHVGPPGWRRRDDSVFGTRHAEAEPFEDAHLLADRNIGAAERAHAVWPQRDPAGRIGPGAGSNRPAGLAAAEFEDQARRNLGAPIGRFGIDTSLEAVAGVGIDLQRPAGRGDRQRVEQRDLEEDLGRLRQAARRQPAHHAGQRLGGIAVANHRHCRCEFVVVADQRVERFAVARPAHRQRGADLAGVEHV